MQVLQEIGSYAGLAAVLGLAVLAALYFSQARDVKRLREWAGRAPERGPETAVPSRVAARPVPRAPGTTLPAPQRAVPTPGVASAAATGAAPATALGPAAATPAAARAAAAARTDEDPDGDAENGGSLSQDTVVHPPPAPPSDDDDLDAEEDFEHDEELASEAGDTADHERAASDLDDDDEQHRDDDEQFDGDDSDDEYDTGDHAVPSPEEHWEDTGDEPAVAPSTTPSTPPLTPAPSLGDSSSSSTSGRPAPATAAGGSSPPILPPYAESRPGAEPGGRGGLFSSRGRAIGVVAFAILILAAVVFGATQLIGGSNSGSDKSATTIPASKTGGGAKTEATAAPSKRKGVAPGGVRVAVLNGTTVPGLAAQIGDSIEKQGFKLGTVTNFNDQQRAESVVLYAPGAEREAAEVGRRLKISQREPIDPGSQSVAGDATVVVVTGRDKTQ